MGMTTTVSDLHDNLAAFGVNRISDFTPGINVCLGVNAWGAKVATTAMGRVGAFGNLHAAF
jgi:hypothetical protein